MRIGNQVDVPKRTARLAGLLYLLSSIPGVFTLEYVPGRLFVDGNPAATADRLRNLERLARAGIAAGLVSSILFIFVALVLYRLFEPVSKGPALAMLVLILLSFPMSFLNVVCEVLALDFAGAAGRGGYLSAFDQHQRDALAYLSMHLDDLGNSIAGMFWGLWLFPFGVCVIRSRFIPRVLGVLLMIAGCGYVVWSFAVLSLPQYAPAAERLMKILGFAEMPIIFWLLIWGAKRQRDRAPAAA